ncbi:hypothetical protein [Nocardia sp. NPDC050717]|uniref:hypothetical protein n=1 Tax=Nocardia sp. NPDC050717 TaxID=3157221 RepID=UPI003408DCCE
MWAIGLGLLVTVIGVISFAFAPILGFVLFCVAIGLYATGFALLSRNSHPGRPGRRGGGGGWSAGASGSVFGWGFGDGGGSSGDGGGGSSGCGGGSSGGGGGGCGGGGGGGGGC